MATRFRWMRGITLVTLLALAGGACKGFFDVENPNLIDGSTLDPVGDLPTFSLSARQNFASAYGSLVLHSAWFAGEARVADTFGSLNDLGRRDIAPTNDAVTSLWQSLSTARASADRVLEYAARSPAQSVGLDGTRAAFFSGYSFLFKAEHFCQGAKDGGPPLDTAMMLDSASARFARAIEDARVLTQTTTGATKAEAEQIVAAGLVGRARARLQAGQKEEALADAEQVPAGFIYDVLYMDDPSNRGRLGNPLWDLTFRRGSLAVAPAFRELDDPRVSVNPPTPELRPADGLTEFWTQDKYAGYGAPIRLASKLEADYISAEAQGTEAMLALIQIRRAANNQPSYTGPTNEASVLSEFMDQRAREFFLEGKALGDTRRHPTAARHFPPAGTSYHKPGYRPIGSQTCYPLPAKETANNPNFP